MRACTNLPNGSDRVEPVKRRDQALAFLTIAAEIVRPLSKI